MRRYSDIARVTGRKGLDGQLVVEPSARFSSFFSAEHAKHSIGAELHFVPPVSDIPRHGTILDIRSFDGAHAVIRVSGIDNVDIAEALTGTHILVDDEMLGGIGGIGTELGGIDLDDFDAAEGLGEDAFIGWNVEDRTTGTLLEVTGSDCPAGQILLSVRTDGDERIRLIPLADGLIESIDEDARLITMDLPAGLLEL